MISMSLILVIISVAYFSPDAPGFVSESVSSNFMEILYLMLIGILVCYVLIGWRGAEKNVGMEMEMEMSVGFRAAMDYVSEILNVEFMKDFDLELGSYGNGGIDGNSVVMDLGDEWLGLPVRSLKSVVDERRGFKCGDCGFCSGCEDEGDRAFGELSPLNLLEKFSKASTLLRVNVVPGSNKGLMN